MKTSMREIVINACFGGFFLSHKATMLYAKKKGMEKSYFSSRQILRDDPTLVEVVKELKKEANGGCAELKIVKIPEDVAWEIEEYDGNEWVSEKHRVWR